ncbi:MAG TPA: toll/interleukin-1 receptor domain-containing protein [Nevskiaceae bacterium]|nr:toll/interleukin-1 receptor domain-containing protein [Nevskiaceae bacterium]
MQTEPAGADPATRYWAFISYSHEDARVARWLHRALEQYRLPSSLVGQPGRDGPLPRRLYPVFRDRDELASSHQLSAALQAALKGSRSLIVLCSPASATSRWVNEEVLAFKRLHGEERVLCLLLENPAGADQERFCPALRQRLDDRGEPSGEATEPLAADLQRGGDGRRAALLKLVAGILGLSYDQLARRDLRRRQRLLGLALAASLAVTAIMAALALAAVQARDEAQARRLQAEQVKAFMVSVFEEQSPLDRGTLQRRSPGEMIADAVGRVEQELAGQPDLQVELMSELGAIQSRLGESVAAETLLRRAAEISRLQQAASSPALAGVLGHLANAVLQQSRYDEARALAEEALEILARHEQPPLLLQAELQLLMAKALSFGHGKAAEAAPWFQRALDLHEQALGPHHGKTLMVLTQLGQFHAQGFDDVEAARFFEEVVRRVERSEGRNATWGANARLELGRLRSRAGHFQEAITAFEGAIAAMRESGLERHDFLAGAYSAVAIAQRSLGRFEDALLSYDQAWNACPVAPGGKQIDVLRGRAAVYLKLNRGAEAERDFKAAYDLARTLSGEDQPYTWYLASEWGRGLLSIGRRDEALALQRKAVERIASLMGPDAHQNAIVLANLAQTLESTPASFTEALEHRQRALAIVEKRYAPGTSLWTEYALTMLVAARHAAATPSASLLALAERLESIERARQPPLATLADAVAVRGLLMAKAGDPAARASLEEALALSAQHPAMEGVLLTAVRQALENRPR